MKSQDKALTRNFNAESLELFCQNRFYGPLVVAFNTSQKPYLLRDFYMQDLQRVEQLNKNFCNKSNSPYLINLTGIKDDTVPDCLSSCPELNQNLDHLYETMDPLIFYMFKYKTAWCPNKKDSHDSKSCIYAHHMRDFRRPPDFFMYNPDNCETL